MSSIYKQFAKSLFDLVTLFAIVDIGAAGAPTINNAPGIASVTRTGAGAYDVVYSDVFSFFIGMDFMLQAAAAEVLTVQITAVDLSTKKISFLCVDDAGVAADPSNGSSIRFALKFSQSSAFPNYNG